MFFQIARETILLLVNNIHEKKIRVNSELICSRSCFAFPSSTCLDEGNSLFCNPCPSSVY